MSRKYSRLLAVVLAVIMVAALTSGCGSKTSGDNEKTKAATTTTVQQSTQEELKDVTLRFFFPGDKKAAADDVWNTVGEKFYDQLKAKFEINYVPWGDYINKMTILSASGDNYDMDFDANWTGLYPKMINKNAYLPLNDLLPKYAPKTYEMLNSAGALEAVKVKGQIMSLPWTMSQNTARIFAAWRSDVAEKIGLTAAKDSIKTVEDFDQFVHDAKKVLPKDMTLIKWILQNYSPVLDMCLAKYELVKLDFHGFVFDLNDPSCKLIPIEQTQAYKESVDIVKKWADDGIISKNMLVEKGDISAEFRAGKLFSTTSTHEWANANQGFSDPAAKQETSELYTDKKSYNRSPLANAVAINRKAANPERTLMFLEMMHTNKELYDLVMYGIEGKTYVLKGESAEYPDGMTAATSNYMDWHGQWAMWSPDFMRPTTTYPAGFWKNEAEYAKNPLNVQNKLDGLFFDTESIKNEIAKRDQLEADDGKILQYGVEKDPAKELNDYIAKQKAAGLDKILAELQKQADAYLANK